MNDYSEYVNAVNKIFDCINIMKEKWTNQDNLNYIEKIEDYKNIVIETSKVVKENKQTNEEEV